MEFEENSRIIAIDFGEVRIGIAVTDPLKIFAYPLRTISNDDKVFQNIKGILSEYNCSLIIIGLPLKESGEHSLITEKVLQFKEKLSEHTKLPIKMVDERYSSSIAQQRVLEKVKSKKKRRDKSLIDKNAAAVILEDYLSSSKE